VRKAKRAAARRGRHLRILFADEARFGRINRPRPCWAPIGIRPEVASQLIREYIYLYGAVSPRMGLASIWSCRDRIRRASRPSSTSYREILPGRISSWFSTAPQPSLQRPRASQQYLTALPAPYSPELNPKENLWDEIREKIFKNYALQSIDAVRAKLKQAILYIERNPETVKSITSFPYILKSL
jgi:hypothetical protein